MFVFSIFVSSCTVVIAWPVTFGGFAMAGIFSTKVHTKNKCWTLHKLSYEARQPRYCKTAVTCCVSLSLQYSSSVFSKFFNVKINLSSSIFPSLSTVKAFWTIANVDVEPARYLSGLVIVSPFFSAYGFISFNKRYKVSVLGSQSAIFITSLMPYSKAFSI